MWKAIIGALSGVVKPVSDYFNTKQVIKAATVERKDELEKLRLETQLESIRKGEDADILMDSKAGTRITWADDITFAMGTLIIGLCFYPPAVPAIQQGFEVLGTMPPEFLWAYGMMLVSVWGYRRLVMPIVELVVSKMSLGKQYEEY